MNEKRNILVTCGLGLKDYLQDEITTLGLEIISSHVGGVVTRGSLIDCMKLNLSLRTANNVLYLLREFRCGSGEALYKQASQIAWENILTPDEYVCVLSKVDTYSVNNSMYPNLKVKDALVDRMQRKTGSRPDSGPQRHGLVINLFWKKDKAWIYLNTSGVKISDRNYRKMPHTAPLRESLAAGLLLAAGYDGSCDLVLPMCGSGTLAIEAAMIATNKPPGVFRNHFGFRHMKDFDEKTWKDLRHDLIKKAGKQSPGHRIIATDRDAKAIAAARQNARTAGVESLIEFATCDFALTQVPDTQGIVMMNPEYGLRLGELTELEEEYARIGNFFKQNCQGYTGYLFTGNRELAKKVGLKTSRRMEFNNGTIDCRLLKYDLYQGSI